MWRLAGISAYFAHPNHLSMISSSHLPFFYYLMLYEKSKFLKLIYMALMAVGIRVVMLTQSRTGMLGVLAFCFFVWVFSPKKFIMLIVAFIGLIVIL